MDKINLLHNEKIIYDKNKISKSKIKKSNLFNFVGSSYYTNVPSAKVTTADELVRYFHESWNHESKDIMCAIVEHKLIDNLPNMLTPKLIRKHFPSCEACPHGNLTKRPITSNPVFTPYETGERWEFDIKGEWKDDKGKSCPTFSGAKWSLVCYDLKSKFVIGFLLRNLGYLLRFLKHLVLLCKQKHRTIKVFRFDKQFLTDEINTFCMHEHISVEPCIPYEHETLPNVERSHRTIQEVVVKDLSAKSHLTFKYWGMAFFDVIDKMNMSPKHDALTTTPYFEWHGRKPDLLRNPAIPFGSIVMAWIPLEDQTALSGRSIKTYYVGMSDSHKGGILLYNFKTKRTIVRRSYRIMGPSDQIPSLLELEALDFKPIEENESLQNSMVPITISPLVGNESKSSSEDNNEEDDDMPELGGDDSDSEDDEQESIPIVRKPNLPPRKPTEEFYKNDFGRDLCLEVDPSDKPIIQHVPVINKKKKLKPGEFYVEKILNHKGKSDKRSSMHFFVKWLGYDDTHNSWIPWSEAKHLAALDTYLINNVDILVPVEKAYSSFTPIQDEEEVILEDDEKFIPYVINYRPPKTLSGACKEDALREYHNLPPYLAYASKSMNDKTIPRSPSQIPSMPDANHWYKATDSEVESMYSNNCWHDLPPQFDVSSIPKNLILPSMLIYERQFNPDGSFKKYKCRLVIRGDKWVDVYNMNQYASTVKSESVRILLSIAAIEDFHMESVDVKTAFLYPKLKEGEIIYMRRPAGLTDKHMPKIVQLDKCIYGMAAASAYFHEHSDHVLKSFGCVPIAEDDCVYVLEMDGEVAYILKHVDDFGLMSKSQHLIDYIKKKLSGTYKLTVNEDMKFYLGLFIVRDREHRVMYVSQPKYIDDLEIRFKLDKLDTYPSTPMAYYVNPPKFQRVFPLDEIGITDYQSRIGSLLYLAIMTRSDILFAVQSLSRFCKSPTSAHLHAVNRILYYIMGTRDKGLKFQSNNGVILHATVDVSYATHDDMKSHTGLTLHIGDQSGACQAQSKKQTIIADSSTVAELIGTHQAGKEIIWARNFLKSVRYEQKAPTIMYEDNMSTIAMIKNKSNGKRTKHVELRYTIIRDHVTNKIIAVEWMPTTEMTADILTKALAPAPFRHLRSKLLGMAITRWFKQSIPSPKDNILMAQLACLF